MSASNRIPVVDLRDTVSGSKDLGSCPQVKELHSSLSTVGFVFLKNHGIDKQMVEGSFAASREFFALSEESKAVFATNAGCGPNGYSSINAKSSPQPNDMKEFFDICNPNCQDVPDAFGTVKTSLYSGCSLLSRKILHMLGFTLQLKDPDFFAHTHTKMEEGFMDNYTFLRLLNYPPVTMVTPTETGYRCAEHVDYGTFSLLFQDKGGTAFRR
ncbi:uncharacterized protein LOC135351592 isoform X2 [Halichondria panicea]|uniref:uncharacterized protein LOC135351592 isoform X2 n=1 Tax=Halichondria panicea TaxID=6063 RepID=UPI00312B8625